MLLLLSPYPAFVFSMARMTLPDARRKLAAALGYAGRSLWRRDDLEEHDKIVLDLVVEALDRLGRLHRPDENVAATQALRDAPSHVQELVAKLSNLATPSMASDPATTSPAEATQTQEASFRRENAAKEENPSVNAEEETGGQVPDSVQKIAALMEEFMEQVETMLDDLVEIFEHHRYATGRMVGWELAQFRRHGRVTGIIEIGVGSSVSPSVPSGSVEPRSKAGGKTQRGAKGTADKSSGKGQGKVKGKGKDK